MEKILKIVKLKDTKSDFDYWKGKSYNERLEALEFLRQQYIEHHNVQPRLQRVCRIVKRKSS